MLKTPFVHSMLVAISLLGVGAHAARLGGPSTMSPQHTPHTAAASGRARGSFDVKVTQLAADEHTQRISAGRFWFDKRWSGELEGTSQGYMLTASTDVEGSGAYVALERFEVTLRGRTGTFVAQHSGWMTTGSQQLTVTIVPDSGTGQLKGLAGKMAITIVDGKHLYDFDYSLPGPL